MPVLARSLRRHGRQVAFACALATLGSAVTAYGVSRQLPDPALAPRHWVVEPVTPDVDARAQMVARAVAPIEYHRHALTRRSDTPDLILRRLGVLHPDDLAFVRRDPLVQTVLDGQPGRALESSVDADGRLVRLVLRGPAAPAADAGRLFTRVSVERSATGGLHTRSEQGAFEVATVVRSATIDATLFGATDAADIPDPITSQLATLFGSEIDFRRDLQAGDRFTVVYQDLQADGLDAPWADKAARLLAARFINDGRALEALWYQAPGHPAGYYQFDGRSTQHAFSAAPLEFTRVTSGFARRFHPILKRWRNHLGTDYGAPEGTPVHSVGEGVVTLAGVERGYGNVVIIRHPGDNETRYAHLSRIGVRTGQAVVQGQAIGAVGQTGWATGPHLHFEFLHAGEHLDPQVVARDSQALQIPPAAMPDFRARAAGYKHQIDVAAAATSLQVAAAPVFE